MQVFGIIGNPVGHSLSPPMHEAAYEAVGMDARYVTFEPDPANLESAVDGAAALGITGLNVTIPFKEEVLEFVEPDGLARRIGAVNTIDFSAVPPTGHNTDAAGVRRTFSHHGIQLSGMDAVVVGAGGAGRAVAHALADAGAHVSIANRTEERAHALAADIDSATGHGLDDLPTLVAAADLLVNATSVGMEEDRSPVSRATLHGDLVVMDAVYRPLETRLLRDADAVGATTIDGAWMLLYQGVAAFERWTGMDGPVDPMNHALRERL